MMWLQLTAAAALLISTITARADWIYEKHDDAFDGVSHFAGTTFSSFPFPLSQFAFTCTTGADLSLTYLTPQKPERQLNGRKARLVIVVDSGQRIHVPAILVSNEKSLGVSSQGHEEAMKALFAALLARDRFAIAVEWDGALFHKEQAKAANISEVIGQLIDNCGMSVD